jgi:RND family efflux transporter MFP subunit
MHKIGVPFFLSRPLLLLSAAAIALTGCSGSQKDRDGTDAAPVEIAPIEKGMIRTIRMFSGSLEAHASFTVSPKVGGRLEEMRVDIGDPVDRGAIVAKLDDAEYQQDLAQAEADLLVARANLAEAQSTLEIAKRAMERAKTLQQRGVASDAELDSARSELLARQAGVEVDQAQITRAEAQVEAAKIRLGYTDVTALWAGADQRRVVAERFIDEGQTVSANTPLLQIVEIDPLSGVFFVTEKDYAKLHPGQHVDIQTDAFPEETFTGMIERIAPVFREQSRQARVEISIPNRKQKLKPGMFIRAHVEIARDDAATIVPAQSIVTRSETQGVFVVNPDGKTASWRPVKTGIREADRIQVLDDGLSGRVVTLGQQLVEDGSPISFDEPSHPIKEQAAE